MTDKKVGRPPRLIGPKQIQDAEVMFKQSVENGKPDYRFVAIAIGSEPILPPTWAMLACVKLAMSMERTAGNDTERRDGDVLDETIRVIARHEDSGASGEKGLRAISVERALQEAYFNLYDEEIGESVRRIRRLWNDEQKQTQFQGLIAIPLKNPRIRTTDRIVRVLVEFESDKMSGPMRGISNPQRVMFFKNMLDGHR